MVVKQVDNLSSAFLSPEGFSIATNGTVARDHVFVQ